MQVERTNKDCKNCVKKKTLYCPNSSECFDILDMPYYQDRAMLLEENDKLKQKIHMALMFYETHKQECVIGRDRDEELTKGYYLPAQLSNKLIEILKGVSEWK